MKGISKGKWAIDERFTNEHGVDVVSIGMWNDKRGIINAIHVFESENGGTSENEAELICTAGNLTNAGYNIEAMPQLVEAFEKLIYSIESNDYWNNHYSPHMKVERQSFERLKKQAENSKEALKYAKP